MAVEPMQPPFYINANSHKQVGNALALALLFLLYQVWSILSDYQDALLYALLCSIALREPKSWLVERIDSSLSRER